MTFRVNLGNFLTAKSQKGLITKMICLSKIHFSFDFNHTAEFW